MSRSYKKHPIIKDNGRGKKKDKRFANRAVRNTRELSEKGNSFKKCFCSYGITDWKGGSYTWEELWEEIKNSDEDMRFFYEHVLKRPYTKSKRNEKELQREFHKMIGK